MSTAPKTPSPATPVPIEDAVPSTAELNAERKRLEGEIEALRCLTNRIDELEAEGQQIVQHSNTLLQQQQQIQQALVQDQARLHQINGGLIELRALLPKSDVPGSDPETAAE